MALIRDKLKRHRIWTADELRLRAKNGQTVLASEIVTHRQQPSTASGVIFASLEDEPGTVNIIVWPSVAEEQRAALRGSKLLSVQGTWQSEKGGSRWSRSSGAITRTCYKGCELGVVIFDEE